MVNIDWLPTIVAATGAKMPNKPIDGLNFLPFLTRKTQVDPREVFYYYFGKNNLGAVRYKNWKLVLPHPSYTYAEFTLGKGGKGGRVGIVQVPSALYDLAHDPGEAYNLLLY
ncbi:MAG: atsA 7 [Mucilaginibacter sp.]|nr:atsA 7 [Mucilaginibacter sp.]